MSTTLTISERLTMIRALDQIKVPNTWLHDSFFPDAIPQLTKKLFVDIKRGTRKKAPFLNPKAVANQVERLGYKTDSYEAPYHKEMVSLDGSDSDDKQFGSEIILQGGISTADYVNLEKAKQLEENKRRIMRSIEFVCATIMDGGVISIVGDGVNRDIDFLMPAAHIITLAGGDLWSDTTNADPNDDLDEWLELLLQASGKQVTDAVFGTLAYKNYKNHPKVKDELDNRRTFTAERVNERSAQYPSLKFRGRYAEVDLWTYAETFDTDAGVATKLIADKKVLLATRGANASTEYAKIQNVEANAAVRFFIDEFKISNPSGFFQVVESAPLPVMPESEAFATVQVLA